MNRHKTTISILIIAALLSCILLFISLFCFNIFWLLKPEESTIRLSTRIKKHLNTLVFPNHFYNNDFITENFVLVNTSNDVTILKTLPYGGTDSISNITTDRNKLLELFRWLSKNCDHYKTVVCDIAFNQPAEATVDDSLNYYIRQLMSKNKIIFAGKYNIPEKKYPLSSIPSISAIRIPGEDQHLGFINYKPDEDDGFTDFDLTMDQGKIESLPFLLYKKVADVKTERSNWLDFINSFSDISILMLKDKSGHTSYVWNRFVPELLFSKSDVNAIPTFESTGGADPNAVMIRLSTAAHDGINMQMLLANNSPNKIVFIGAFSSPSIDQHKTLYGDAAGSIVLINIYHNLLKGENTIDWKFFIFLFFAYFFILIDLLFSKILATIFYWVANISMLLFIPQFILYILAQIFPVFRRAYNDFKDWLKEESHYFFLILVTFIANIFFNNVINIIIISACLFLIGKVCKYMRSTQP